MKTIVIAALVALAFTTGFTCSKNQPADTSAPAQEQMAAPAEGTTAPAEGTAAPAEGTTAPAPTEGTTPAPTEGTGN